MPFVHSDFEALKHKFWPKLCDLAIKAPPIAHFWKCYCASKSLGQGHVQKLHTSNKDLLLEQLLHLKHPDISFPTGSSFPPERCMAAKKLILQEWNWGPLLAFSKRSSDSLQKGKKPPAETPATWKEQVRHKHTVLRAGSEQGGFQEQWCRDSPSLGWWTALQWDDPLNDIWWLSQCTHYLPEINTLKLSCYRMKVHRDTQKFGVYPELNNQRIYHD